MRNLKRVLTIALIAMASLGISISTIVAQNYAQASASDGTLRRLRVPILMYHYVSQLPENPDELRRGLTVTPQQFREHLDYLKARQYTSVSLYEIYLALTQGYRLPDQPVALTFDDGYKEHLTTVVPALRERGLTGTFFIITGNADNQRPGYLNWDEVNQIASQGMEIASHTKSHVDLRTSTHATLVYEILGSIESIQAHVRTTTIAFAYPMGRYNEETMELLRQVNIAAAVTTSHGTTHTSDQIMELRRLRVQNTTGVPGLEVLLQEK